MSPRISRRSLIASVLAAAVALGMLAACSDDEGTAPGAPRLAYGPSAALGQDTARSDVTQDAAGVALTLGVAISESAIALAAASPRPRSARPTSPPARRRSRAPSRSTA